MSASEAVMHVRQCAGCRGSVPMTAIWNQSATECKKCKRRLHLRCVIWLKIPPVKFAAEWMGYFGEKVEHCRLCAANLVLAFDEVEVAG